MLLWVEYLAEVGAAGEVLAEAIDWALTHFDEETLDVMDKYAQLQQSSLPIIYGTHYCQHQPAAWQGVTWGWSKALSNGCCARDIHWPASTTGYRP
ncbi:MAG TPA: hypothetical protein PLD25_29940 [Chloroflexota bacterium]|nr:hypothetical protein [Chloroflexota bacterium]